MSKQLIIDKPERMNRELSYARK